MTPFTPLPSGPKPEAVDVPSSQSRFTGGRSGAPQLLPVNRRPLHGCARFSTCVLAYLGTRKWSHARRRHCATQCPGQGGALGLVYTIYTGRRGVGSVGRCRFGRTASLAGTVVPQCSWAGLRCMAPLPRAGWCSPRTPLVSLGWCSHCRQLFPSLSSRTATVTFCAHRR